VVVGLARRGITHSIPISRSARVALYLESREQIKYVKVFDLSVPGNIRYVKQPTKYHPQYSELVKQTA
jgi:hypothetical protein